MILSHGWVLRFVVNHSEVQADGEVGARLRPAYDRIAARRPTVDA